MTSPSSQISNYLTSGPTQVQEMVDTEFGGPLPVAHVMWYFDTHLHHLKKIDGPGFTAAFAVIDHQPDLVLGARAGSVNRARGVLGAAAWPTRAVARVDRAAVSAPSAPSVPSSAAAAAPGEAPGARAGATLPRWRRGEGHGQGRGAAYWSCGLSPLCAWGPLRRQGGRACSLSGGGGLWVASPVSA